MDKITNEHAAMKLLASGTAVGLSEGLMGNSEVGYVERSYSEDIASQCSTQDV